MDTVDTKCKLHNANWTFHFTFLLLFYTVWYRLFFTKVNKQFVNTIQATEVFLFRYFWINQDESTKICHIFFCLFSLLICFNEDVNKVLRFMILKLSIWDDYTCTKINDIEFNIIWKVWVMHYEVMFNVLVSCQTPIRQIRYCSDNQLAFNSIMLSNAYSSDSVDVYSKITTTEQSKYSINRP